MRKDEQYIDDLETLVDRYSQLILSPIAQHQFDSWNDKEAKVRLTQQLQDITAQCVKQVEVIRAKRLLDGRASTLWLFR